MPKFISSTRGSDFSTWWSRVLAIVVSGVMCTSVDAMPIANSVSDFSANQGQGGWNYGIFNQGADNSTAYMTGAFEELDEFVAGSWRASDALVGAQNNDFLRLDNVGGHPTGLGPGSGAAAQDSIIWAVRRYTTSVAGPLFLNINLRKSNFDNERGGGITGRIFVDGAEILTRFIENSDNVGLRIQIPVDVNIGSLIDFVIDPTGISPGPPLTSDNDFSARADGTVFSVLISDTPVAEPGTLALLGLGLIVAGTRRRR